MTKINEDDLRKILEELPEGGKISMKELLRASGWMLKEMQNFLLDYDERKIKTVAHEPIGKTIEDFVYFPDRRLSTYPVYEVSNKPKEYDRPVRQDVGADRILTTGGDTVLVPIGQKLSESALVRLVLQSGTTYAEAEDTVDWWKETGDIFQTSSRGAPIYMAAPRGLPPPDRIVKKIEMHTLPYTRLDQKGMISWDPLELFEYMMRTFGWTKAEGRDYLYGMADKGTAKYQKFRDYRLPTEIPIEVYKTIRKAHYEPKPIAMRVIAVTRWQARSGAGYKDQASKKVGQKRVGRKYDQDHELNAFVRIPKGTTDNEMEDMALDLINMALEAHDNPYPNVHNIQKRREAGGWQAEKPTMNTTAMTQMDGEWIQYFNGDPRQNGDFDPDKFYRAYGIKVD